MKEGFSNIWFWGVEVYVCINRIGRKVCEDGE